MAAGASSSSAAAATAASSSTIGTASSSQPDFLTLILELDPRLLLSDPASTQLLVDPNLSAADTAANGNGNGKQREDAGGNALTRFLLPALLIFLNAHIALQHGNGLAIYLATPTSPTRLIYTSAPGRMALFQSGPGSEADAVPDPNTYQHFGIVNRALWSAVRRAVQDAADWEGDSLLDVSDDSEAEEEAEGGQRRRPRKRRRRQIRRSMMTSTGPLVSALSQALAHLNNIPPSSSSSTASSAAQATNLPSGHNATILPRAQASMSSASSLKQGDQHVAGGGLPSWRPRLLILSTLDGGSGGTGTAGTRRDGGGGASSAMAYVPLMNCIFAAQKRGILIDVLKLTQGQDVVFLQQAAHLTGGNYLRLDLDEKGEASAPAAKNSNTGGRGSEPCKTPLSLLQVLMTTFLPSRDLRYFPPTLALSSVVSSNNDQAGSAAGGVGILRLPTLDSVDFRAACFCHRRVVDVGFVCSVCLSIFCEPRKQCLICDSRFPRSTMRRFEDEHKVAAALTQFAALAEQ
ncbi:hypothetical protein V8E36_006403 [Tilletia maclaganii]